MSNVAHRFAAAEELPIPQDAQVGPGWTAQMIEMADHIGAYATLLLIDRFAGMSLYIPADWTRGKVYDGRGSIREIVGDRAAQILSHVYRREYLELPTAHHAIARAKRAPIIAAVRQGRMTITEAARKLRSRRPYISQLVNQSDEGSEGAAGELPIAGHRDPGQPDLFGDDEP